jgi:hypothetical protein
MTGTLQDLHFSSLPNCPSITSKHAGTRSKLILNKSISENSAWPLIPQRGHLRYSTHELQSAIPQYARLFASRRLNYFVACDGIISKRSHLMHRKIRPANPPNPG